IAPFGPVTVVIGDLVVAEQILQHEPRVAGALADATVGYHGLRSVDSFAAVQSFQFVIGLERAVLVNGLAPGDGARSGDMSAALAGLGQSRRRQDLAGEFL